jgi:amino acid transporter
MKHFTDIIEWTVDHLVHFTIISTLLATGAVIGRYYPPVVWWLLGFAGVAALCIAALFGVALIANAMDDPMDGYPGS